MTHITAYHSVGNAPSTPNEGDLYFGADREKLSDFLGGKVGFAYAHLPEGWDDDPNVWKLLIPEENPVVLDLVGNGVPRRDYTGKSFEDILYTDDFFKGFAGDLPAILLTNKNFGELAFLSLNVRFNHSLK